MGESVSYKCPKCGYSFIGPLGSGFLYPDVYFETVEKMKSGEFGEKAKQFFIDIPDGAVDCENVMLIWVSKVNPPKKQVVDMRK